MIDTDAIERYLRLIKARQRQILENEKALKQVDNVFGVHCMVVPSAVPDYSISMSMPPEILVKAIENKLSILREEVAKIEKGLIKALNDMTAGDNAKEEENSLSLLANNLGLAL